ncbi:MAG: hypothetical protein ACLGIO_09090 [Acidimicrobiia bacterium]
MVMLTDDGRPVTDAKAGRCQPCREGHHVLCASDTCACPDRRRHTRRPSYGRTNGSPARAGASPAPPRPAPAPRPTPPRSLNRQAKPAGPAEVVFELVEADPPAPPAKPKRLTNAERARPLLEQIMAEGRTKWQRLAIHPSARGAGQLVGAFRKAYPPSEWEFKAVAIPEVGQSAVYVRWLGEKATVL